MSEAIKCDRCGEFEATRYAALDVEIETVAREYGGGLVLPDGTLADWSREEEGVDLCSSCAAPVIEWLDEYLDEVDDE